MTPLPDLATPRLDRASRPARRSFLRSLRLKAFGRRRRLLINRKYQLASALRTVTGAGFLVALLVFVLNQVNLETSRDLQQMAPFMKPGLERWDRITFLSLILGSAVFLLGVLFLDILKTHRTAGAFHNLRKRLEEIRCGRLTVRLALRRHDNFPELEKSFNDAVASLRLRTEGELATLGRLSQQVRDLIREQDRGNGSTARPLAETLLQALEELRCRKAELLEP